MVRLLASLGSNVAWATVGIVFNQGSTLASNIWIANLLGKSVFGQYAIVLTTVQATAAFASLGVGYTTTRYISEWRHRDVVRAGQLLGLFSRLSWVASIGAALLLAAASSGLSGVALKAPALGPSLLIAAGSTFFSVRNGFLTGALTGLESFKSLGVSGIVSGLAYTALCVGGAATGGVRGAALGLLVSALVQCLVLTALLQAARNRHSLTGQAASFTMERPLLMRFAVPAALSGFSTVPVLWTVQAFLARSPKAFDEVAVYTAGLNLLSMVLFGPAVLNGVATGWINRSQVVEGEAAYRGALRANIVINLLTVGCALVAVIVLGPRLLGLYGSGFRTGYLALLLLVTASLPEVLTNALNQSLQTRERMWESFLAVNIPRDIVILAGSYTFVPLYGAVGAAGSYLAGRCIACLAMFLLVRHEMRPLTPESVAHGALGAER